MITYSGFSKLQNKYITVVCTDQTERRVIKTLYEVFDKDTEIDCREINGYLLETLPLDAIYKEV